MILYEAEIGSFLILETSANLGACIDDVDKEYIILNDLIFDVLGNSGSCVVGINLCSAARGSVKSVGKVGR